ncbi:MAG: hypothetical protein TREMPRED_005405 [Tremellales sp. Tagirdzhanova-0007]|nr:MAG: hypothetical protein TREMPRED_005405 [Tremellales sp. Tagirdzhanova-0007]
MGKVQVAKSDVSQVSNLAHTSSLLYHSYLSSPLYGLHPDRPYTPVVNWVGFYVRPPSSTSPHHLDVGPYNGRPACTSINTVPGKGVCADAFVSGRERVVPDVSVYPGHIACDGETKAEIVIPLRILSLPEPVGVLDLDSTILGTFDDDDLAGLLLIVDILGEICEWA